MCAAIGLLVATACQSSTEPSVADLKVTTTVSSTSSSVTALTIATTVTNESSRTITLEISNCPRRFRVETLAGSQVALASQLCTLAAVMKSLPPGASHSFNNQWDGRDGNGIRLSGSYRVIGAPFSTAGHQSVPVTVVLGQ
ncbi:MAG: hypothetical protein ABI852_17155 [Gemmatimonadaceae bacterium]